MALQLTCAAALVFGTVLVHTACTLWVIAWVRPLANPDPAPQSAFRSALRIAAVVLLMALAGVVESALWAAFYWGAGALSTFREALYFSLVTLTTLGYGDVTLSEDWRLLSAFEAANGIILFGWTTALIVAVGQRVFAHGARPEGDV